MARHLIRNLALAALAFCVSAPAFAQTTYPTPAGSRVQAVVTVQCDAAQTNCQPTSGGPSAPSATSTAGTTNISSVLNFDPALTVAGAQQFVQALLTLLGLYP